MDIMDIIFNIIVIDIIVTTAVLWFFIITSSFSME